MGSDRSCLRFPNSTAADIGSILVAAFCLTLVWLRKGLLLAGGESEFIDVFYATQRQIDRNVYAWLDISTGLASLPHDQAVGLPLYLMIGSLRSHGLSPLLAQWFVLFLVLAGQGVAIYFLTYSALEGKVTHLGSVAAGLFYMLNPFSMVQVWGRFLSVNILMYLLLPLMLLLYMKGLQKHSFRYAVCCCLFSVPLSYSLRAPAFLMLLWFPLLAYFFFYLLKNVRTGSRKNVMYAVKFSAFFITIWSLLNAWWLLPFFTTFGSIVASYPSAEVDLAILLDISGLLNPYYVVRLIRSDYGWPWPTEVLSFIIPALVIYSVFSGRKIGHTWFFLALSFVGVFLAKGAAPPFGEIFAWFFARIHVLGAFRNSFEKFGLILPLGYAPLVGFALSSIQSLVTSHLPKNSVIKSSLGEGNLRKVAPPVVVAMILFLITVPLVWPMWTGAVFQRNYVEIPSYYGEADFWLNQQRGEFRILSLPLQGFGVVYNWTHGYDGVEPSNVLFSKPFISKQMAISLIDDNIIGATNNILYKTDRLWKLMAALNAKYVVIHRDVIYRRDRDSPVSLTQVLTHPTVPGNATSRLLVGDTGVKMSFNFSYPSNQWWNIPVPESLTNWSSRKFLNVCMRRDEAPGLLGLAITVRTVGGKWQYRIGFADLPQPNSLSKYVIPLNRFDAVEGTPDWTRVKILEFAPEVGPVRYSGSIWIEDMGVDSGISSTQEHIHFERTFGQLDFYKVEDQYFLDRAYLANRIIMVKNPTSMFEDMQDEGFTPGKDVFVLQSQVDSEEQSSQLVSLPLASNPPMMTFSKADPTRYSVHVERGEGPFLLVLSETYDPRWEATYASGKKITSHIIVNGYANAWYVDEQGPHEITLEFRPQRLFSYSTTMSLIAIGITVLYLAVDSLRTVSRRKSYCFKFEHHIGSLRLTRKP